MALERFEILADLSAAMTANDNLSKIMFDIDFREMWINAQILLGNGPGSVRNGLTALEQRMDQALQTKVILATKDTAVPSAATTRQNAMTYWAARNQKNPVEKNTTYQHILSEVLTTAEKNKDFTHDGTGWWNKARGITPGVPYMASVVSAQVFDYQLQNAQQWKDVGVPPEHGEYTHRIQWFIISESADIPKPAQLMKGMANYGPSKDAASAAWDAVVDRLKETVSYGLFHAKGASDFRSPEYFNNYLTGGAADGDFPLLTAFLKARRQKRETNFDIYQYVSKKLYNKPYGSLTEKEKARVDTVIDPKKEQGMIRRSEVKG